MKTASIISRLGIFALAATLAHPAFMSASAQTMQADHMLILRKGPNPSYPVLTIVPPGMAFQMNGCPLKWCEISTQGQTGYISLKNLFPEPPPAWQNRLPPPPRGWGGGGGASAYSHPPASNTQPQGDSTQWNGHWDLSGNNIRRQGSIYLQNH